MRGGRFLLVALALFPRSGWSQGGNPLGPEFHVNTFLTGYQRLPAVALDPAGGFVVVWTSRDQDGSGYGVFGQRYSSGGIPAGPEFRINTYTTNGQQYPAVSSDGAGNFVVAWHSFQGGSNDVFGQRFTSTGSPLGPEFRINTFTSNSQERAALASDSAGNFVVVWTSTNPNFPGVEVFGQRYAGNGTPLGTEFHVNTFTTDSQSTPKVASDASGDFVVVWQGNFQDGAGYGVFGQRFGTSGAPLGSEFRVNTYTSGFQLSPSVAADGPGDFVVVWMSDQDGDQFGIFGQRFASTGAPLGPEFRVNTFTIEHQGPPAVASDAAGNFVVVWRSRYQDGSNDGIFGQRFDSAGAPSGAEFRINSYTTNDQSEPAVAADALGSFVVVWKSELQGSYFNDIFGQRYRPIVPVDLLDANVE